MKFDNYTLLFCNGFPPSRKRLESLIPRPALIVCADGGAQKALALGYVPDVVVGDFDSFAPDDRLPPRTELLKIPNQDNTDFEKTLDAMLSRGANSFVVAAFSGGRIDQTVANLQIAFEYCAKCRLALVDEEYTLIPVVDKWEERIPSGTTVSLLAMTDDAVVSTSGLAFELTNARLPKGGHGISNVTSAERPSVTVHHGGVMIMIKDA